MSSLNEYTIPLPPENVDSEQQLTFSIIHFKF